MYKILIENFPGFLIKKKILKKIVLWMFLASPLLLLLPPHNFCFELLFCKPLFLNMVQHRLSRIVFLLQYRIL